MFNHIDGKSYELDSRIGDFDTPTERQNWVWTSEYMVTYTARYQNQPPDDVQFRCLYEEEFENGIELCKQRKYFNIFLNHRGQHINSRVCKRWARLCISVKDEAREEIYVSLNREDN
jgi:hypothetical protein